MILHIDCNSFYASCEISLRPDLEGKPVVVANCNEAGGGIILALTKEAKKLGLKRGNPIFQVKDIINKNDVVVFPANLPKYVDISKRLMQVVKDMDIVLNFKQYSVDEFFGELPLNDNEELRKYATDIKQQIKRCTGIPVSCGLSLSYTLAKVATWYAKHYNGYDGVCVLPEEKISTALKLLPINEVWGVGRRTVPIMQAMGVHTAWDFVNKPAYEVERCFKINGLHTWKELHGEQCISIDNPTIQKSIAYTRTFTYMTDDIEKLRTYISNYSAAAARKLRDQHSICGIVSTFITTNPHRDDLSQYGNIASVKLAVSTADSMAIAKAAIQALEKIYSKGYQYKRAGVILNNIVTDEYIQLDFFEQSYDKHKKSKALMEAMDGLNTKFGMNSIRLASQGFETAQPNLNNFQPLRNETTNIGDIIEVH